jgi:thiol:disulfide interchange protein
LKIFFSILVVTVLAFAAEKKLGVSYKDAIEGNKKNNKPILVEFYAAWCIPCLEMEKTVFKDPAVLKELKNNFYFVRLDTEKEQEIFCEGETLPILSCMSLWELEGIPAFAVLDLEGKLRHLVTGEFKKAEFLNLLKAFRVNLNK